MQDRDDHGCDEPTDQYVSQGLEGAIPGAHGELRGARVALHMATATNESSAAALPMPPACRAGCTSAHPRSRA